MRMDFKVLFFVLTVWAATPVFSWWDWGGREWSETIPSNCPSNDSETHVCRDLYAANTTCITIKCCRDFDESEYHFEYDSEDYDDDDDNSTEYHMTHDYSDNSCVLCASIRDCVAYKCYERCCDGYERDMYGRCRNATGGHECQNGGTSMYSRCYCPHGFTGVSCEVPICHGCMNGDCMVRDGRPYCNCSEDYSGENCEQALCTLDCLNGGKCYKQGGYEKCWCPDKYIGKYCEQYFVSPETCPANEHDRGLCETQCMSNDGCYDDQICCKEGCSTVCRRPVMDHCEHNGMKFQIGDVYKPTPCEDCTCTRDSGMMCRSMSCEYPKCPNGRTPEVKPGKCCPECPEEPQHKPPTMFDCYVYKMYEANTTGYSDYAYLKSCHLGIYALDENEKKLEVKFRPDKIRRPASYHQRPTFVIATATDSNGKSAMCKFHVIVKDINSPRFLSCPGDIYVFHDERPTWLEPIYEDNVGIAGRDKMGKGESGDMFEIGEHRLTYRVWDYDRNVAECSFRVIVVDKNTDFEDMPQGLKQRSKDNTSIKLAIILAPIIGGLALLAIIIIALCCFMRRLRHHKRSTRTSTRSVRTAYDNNIYDVPVDVKDKATPPAYTEHPLPQNPPAYSRTGSFRGSVYESEAPPSYSNPDYDTVGEGMKPVETISH